MTIHVTPIPSTIEFAEPSFSLTSANAAGSAITAVASNSDLLVFDATVPSNIATTTTAASAGVATVAPRRDHVHGSTAVVGQASKAEAEAEDDVDKYVPPDLIKNIPGVAKAYGSADGGGNMRTGAGYNATVTLSSTGVFTWTWGDDFSTAVFSPFIQIDNMYLGYWDTGTAGGMIVRIKTVAGALIDSQNTVVVFGKQ